MMMSTTNGLLYDGTITNITQNNFTANFTIYTNGQNPITATASGTITQGSSITGTLTGTGVGNGTFSLTYATTNNQVAAISRIENTTNVAWGAIVGNSPIAFEFTIDAVGTLTDETNEIGGGLFHICVFDFGVSTIAPVANTNIYQISASILGCENSNVIGANYTGLASTRSQGSTDDTLVFVMTNGTYSFNGDFQ